MLAEAEKRDAANKKRSATMRAKAAAQKAARLTQPPANLDDAWQRHAETCPYPPYSDEASAWFREHSRFEFDGTTWRREKTYQKTNSGKGKRLRSITYYGADARVVTTYDAGANRRNDPERDWGLPD